MGFLPGDLTAEKARLLMGRHPLHWVEVSDRIRLRVYARNYPGQVRLSGRLLALDGSLTTFSDTYDVAATGRTSFATLRVGTGFLVDLVVDDPNGDFFIANLWCQCDLVTGEGDQLTPIAVLCQGYVGRDTLLALGRLTDEGEAGLAGRTATYSVAAPDPGANFALTFNDGVEVELLALTFLLTAAVAVATRTVILQADPVGTLVYQLEAHVTQTATQAFTYWWTPTPIAAVTSGTNQYERLPIGMRIKAGGQLRSVITNLQAADQLSNIKALVVEHAKL